VIVPATTQVNPKDALVLKIQGRSGRATLFMKLNDLFPECQFLISDEPQLYPLSCLERDSCPRNQNCMEKLVVRIRYVFDTFGDVQNVLLYFRHQDRPDSHRAGVFYRDMEEPRFITFNRAAWEKCKEIGTAYQWSLPDSLFLQTGVSAPDRLFTLKTS
jgi:hypothetical protein